MTLDLTWTARRSWSSVWTTRSPTAPTSGTSSSLTSEGLKIWKHIISSYIRQSDQFILERHFFHKIFIKLSVFLEIGWFQNQIKFNRPESCFILNYGLPSNISRVSCMPTFFRHGKELLGQAWTDAAVQVYCQVIFLNILKKKSWSNRQTILPLRHP